MALKYGFVDPPDVRFYYKMWAICQVSDDSIEAAEGTTRETKCNKKIHHSCWPNW